MEVIVHYPTSLTGQRALKQKVAEIHVQSIINYINEMQLSEEDTRKLINIVCQKATHSNCIHNYK